MATRVTSYVYAKLPLPEGEKLNRRDYNWLNPPHTKLHNDPVVEYLMWRNPMNPSAVWSVKRDVLEQKWGIVTPKLEHGARETMLNYHLTEVYDKVFGLQQVTNIPMKWKTKGIKTKPKIPDMLYVSNRRLHLVECKLLINPHNSGGLEHVMSAYYQLRHMERTIKQQAGFIDLGLPLKSTLMIYVNPNYNLGRQAIEEWKAMYPQDKTRIVLRNGFFPMESITW